MFGNGLEIAGTTTIRVRSPTVVLGKAGSVVGALCAAAPIAIFRGSSARPSATGPNRQAGTTAAGSAWLEHCHESMKQRQLFFSLVALLFVRLCWAVCFWWMHRISSRQDALLKELHEMTRRIEKLSRREHDLISDVHPKVKEIKEDVENVREAVSPEND